MKKEFKSGTIKNLHDHISAKIKEYGFDDETLQERLLILTEEIGELIASCRRIEGGIGYVKEHQHNKLPRTYIHGLL